MDISQNQRSFTLEQTAEELHLAPETIQGVLKQMNIHLDQEPNRTLTEGEVSRVMELLNSPAEPRLT